MRLLLIQETDWLKRNPLPHHHLAEMLSLRGHEVRVIAECRIDSVESPFALNKHVVRIVDEDVADRRISEERFKGAESRNLPNNVLDDFIALGLRERRRFIS